MTCGFALAQLGADVAGDGGAIGRPHSLYQRPAGGRDRDNLPAPIASERRNHRSQKRSTLLQQNLPGALV